MRRYLLLILTFANFAKSILRLEWNRGDFFVSGAAMPLDGRERREKVPSGVMLTLSEELRTLNQE